jgi:hypothetical protein
MRSSSPFTLLLLTLVAMLGVCRPIAAEEIPLASHGNTYSVPVRLNDVIILNFVLDTGAADVAVPADVVSTLLRTGTVADGDFVGRATYVLADGSRLPSLRFILREVRVGNQSVRNVVASVSPAKGELLLGQSYLSRLPPWTIDYSRHALVINGAAPSQTGVVSPPSVVAPPSGSVPQLFGAGVFGAFGHDEATGKYGYSWNQGTQQLADEAALKGCASEQCKIVFRTGPKECGAIAMNADGKVWGGAKRPTRQDAETAALANCRIRSPTACQPRASECNQ